MTRGPKEDNIRKKNNRIVYKYFLSFLRWIIVICVLTISFSSFFRFKIIKGTEMYPFFMDGDLTLVWYQPSYVKNEIVFYTVDNIEYVGRIVAKGGDEINFSSGKFYNLRPLGKWFLSLAPDALPKPSTSPSKVTAQ